MNRSLLGLDGGGADEAPARRSLLGLEEVAFPPPSRALALDPHAAPSATTAGPAPDPPPRPGVGPSFVPVPVPVPVPELEREIFGVEKGERARAFPVERAILLSLGLHILLFFILLHAPSGGVGEHNLFPGLSPREKTDEEKIPIVFRAAPGPERENRKPSDFSDRNRRAGGGDRSKPRSDLPFAPVLPGKEGLSAGSAPRAAEASPAGPRGGQDRSGEKGAPAEKSQSSTMPPDDLNNPAGASGGSGPGTRTAASSNGLPNLDQVIKQEATRLAAARGEGGAGMPNPDGGFVDSGPLSFETSWYDWGAYADEMVRRIKLHWDIPKLAELGWKGRLTIHFDIRVDGSVSGARLVSGSGIPPFDYAAMQAILRSNPFRPLPKDLLKEVPGKQKEGVTVTFFYNMRPGKDEKFGNGS